MYKIITSATLTIFLFGCAAPLEVQRLEQFTPESNSFVLLSHSPWDNKLRTELSKNGMKILKFASQNTVISNGKQGEIARIYDEAGAKYGLSFTWLQVDYCLTSTSRKINATLEVTDLRTNEVLIVIEKGGFTEQCGIHSGELFKDLAKALAVNWIK